MIFATDELMRKFLISLCKSKRGGEIKVPMKTLEDQNTRLNFRRDGRFMVLSLEVVKDQWGRIVDRCGQVKCLKCDVYINYSYSDGSKRTLCAQHEA